MSNTLSINLGVLHLPMAKMYLKLHVTFNLTDAKVSVSIYKQICLSLSLSAYLSLQGMPGACRAHVHEL